MINKKLQNLITKLANKDQYIRWKIIKKGFDKKREISRCDSENLSKIKKIINKYDWPTFNLIGKKASHKFWLLVQHADKDLKFQEKCLKLLKKIVKNKQAYLNDYAFLTDRVLVNQGKKQKYGTQFYKESGKYIPKPVFDVKNVNKRRKKLGLNTLEEYIKNFNKKYKKFIK